MAAQEWQPRCSSRCHRALRPLRPRLPTRNRAMHAEARSILLSALLSAGCAATPSLTTLAHSRSENWNAEMLTTRHQADRGLEAVYSVDWRKLLTEPEFLEWTPREFTRPAVDDSGRVYVAT